MEDDLNLDDQKYAWVLSIFFFGYLLCEVPSNMILSRSRPSLFLPGIMIVWGALSAAMASAQTYGAMLAFRFVVGCIESGFFPGVLYLLSCWYTSGELGKSSLTALPASTPTANSLQANASPSSTPLPPCPVLSVVSSPVASRTVCTTPTASRAGAGCSSSRASAPAASPSAPSSSCSTTRQPRPASRSRRSSSPPSASSPTRARARPRPATPAGSPTARPSPPPSSTTAPGSSWCC